MGRLADIVGDLGVDALPAGDGAWAVRVPSEKRGSFTVHVLDGDRTVALRAFIMRSADRRHEDVYRRLLRKNLDTSAWRFAIDDYGDVFLAADVPLAGLDADGLDGLLGASSSLVDEVYEGILRTGFDVGDGFTLRRPPDA